VDDEDERSDEELRKYANAMYDEMDKDKDDKVTWEEYYHVVRKDQDYVGETKAEEKEDFLQIDANNDGHISRAELVKDWLREDLDFADDDELDEDDEDDEDEDDEDEDDEGPEGGRDEDDEASGVKKSSLSKSSKSSSKSSSSKAAAKESSKDGTLGDKLKETALKIFKTRAPKASSINVKLFQTGGVSWSQADGHCRKLNKRICPERAIMQLKLCRDPDPSHKGRSTPLDTPGVWMVLDKCQKENHGADLAKKALIACC